MILNGDEERTQETLMESHSGLRDKVEQRTELKSKNCLLLGICSHFLHAESSGSLWSFCFILMFPVHFFLYINAGIIF